MSILELGKKEFVDVNNIKIHNKKFIITLVTGKTIEIDATRYILVNQGHDNFVLRCLYR